MCCSLLLAMWRPITAWSIRPLPTQYIRGLAVPGGLTMDFEEIFQKAFNNIVELWGWLALSLQKRDSPLDTLASWSLDTGIDETDRMIYWS